MKTCSSECFVVCSTSFTGQFLVFELQGDSCLGSLSITTSKSTTDGLLEKPSTASLLTGVSSSRIIGEELFLLLNSVSVESSLNGVVLIVNFFFRVGSSSFTSLLFNVSVVLKHYFEMWLFYNCLFQSTKLFVVIKTITKTVFDEKSKIDVKYG